MESYTVNGMTVNAALLVIVALALLTASFFTLIVLLSHKSLRDDIGFYLLSLSLSDLLCALFIIPFSVYAAINPDWHFESDNSSLCKFESYIGVVLLSTIVYTLLWISVDRYSALNTPIRHDSEQVSYTRCKCWIAFTWLSSLLLSCPILVANMHSEYYPEAYLCLLDWRRTVAYSITWALLVLLPSLCTMLITVIYLLWSMLHTSRLDNTQRTVLDTDHNFVLLLFLLLAFTLSWIPWLLLRIFQSVIDDWLMPVDSAPLHFAFIWLAIGGGSWRFVIYLFVNTEFRRAISSLCCFFYCGRNRLAKRYV